MSSNEIQVTSERAASRATAPWLLRAEELRLRSRFVSRVLLRRPSRIRLKK